MPTTFIGDTWSAEVAGLPVVFFTESIMKWLVTLLLVKTVSSADQNPDGKPWFHLINLKFWWKLSLMGNVVNNGVAINCYWDVVDMQFLFLYFWLLKKEIERTFGCPSILTVIIQSKFHALVWYLTDIGYRYQARAVIKFC